MQRPYLYVGPNPPLPDDPFWNAPFGAVRTWDDTAGLDGALAFFLDGAARAG